MEEQNVSQMPQPSQFQVPISQSIPLEALEALKARAREEALRITLEQNAALAAASTQYVNPIQQPPQQSKQPEIIYVRRNLTIAELLLMLFIACGLVTGTQFLWNVGTNLLPRIEVKMK